MATVKLGCFLLIGLALAYVANAKVISSGGFGHRLRSPTNRPIRGSRYQPPATHRPPQHSDWWWSTPAGNDQAVTPDPTDGTETRRPFHGGNRHQFRPITPDPTGDTTTRRPISGSHRDQFRPTAPRTGDTTTRSPGHGGHHQHVTDRPYHHTTASRSELNTPLPTNSFQSMLQRYLRKLQSHSAAPLEKKSHNDVESRAICPNDHFQCNSGTCLRSYVRCNGHDECGDGSDEHNCNAQNVRCPAGRVACRHTGVCIDTDWICDGENDCLDWSDEEKCSSDGRWGRSWQTTNREKKDEAGQDSASEQLVGRKQTRKDVISDLFNLKRRLSED